jgi:hypothetical protein
MLQSIKMSGRKMKVLVPTDFSGSGVNAAAFAIKLFDKKTDEIILENVFQIPKENKGTLVSIDDIISNESKLLLEKERRHLKAEYKNANVTVQSEEGNVVSTIKNAIKKKGISLLVIGLQKQVSSLSKVTSAFIEQPQYWPMLTVPLKPLNKSKEIVIVISENSQSDNSKDLTDYLRNIDLYESAIHRLQFSIKEGIEHLKSKIDALLKKHKVGIIVFDTNKADLLQKTIIEHKMDNILLSIPALLIQHNG